MDMGETSDKIKQNLPKPFSYLRSVINVDEETRHDRLDKLIVKVFPVFLVLCVIFTVFLIFYLNNFSFRGVIFGICLGFVLSFAALGIVCITLADKGVITGIYIVPLIIIIPALVSLLMNFIGSNIGFNEFMVKYFDIFGKNLDLVSILISVYSITLLFFCVAYGVLSVIVGYFRSYFYRVLRSLEKPLETRRGRISKWLFQIPDIIDVESIELDPDTDDDKFNTALFFSTFFSLFVLGIVICSYLFINPLFLRVMPFEEMLLIGMLLSLFISPLVIPWSIVKSIGAKVTSDAPRDYYLWKGMRGRLYQGFFAITFFMMLLTLSVYLGMDFSRIATTYLGYLIFMGTISVITSFIYVNTYYKGFKNGIIKSYILSKEQ